ncbi:MAG: hypothetical protein JSV20_00485 [Candidatus Bathyarchaeota archaeon]|nr:MAG: hypothetical protein JSV20_00485 [Candidatus Bathyarchaeota archaeon]
MLTNKLIVVLTVVFITLLSLFPSDSRGPASISRLHDADYYVGVGMSPWSLNDKSADEWIQVAHYLASQCDTNGTIAPLLGISIGGMQKDGSCHLFTTRQSQDPSDPYIKYGTDYLTPILKQADTEGVAIFLGVESGRARVSNLLTILETRTRNHPCVIGFMVDMEWVLEVSKDKRESLIDDWYRQVRDYGNYQLYLVSWVTSRIDRYDEPHIVYLYDGQDFIGYSHMERYIMDWGDSFHPAKVGVYYGYNSDWDWQQGYTVKSLQALILSVPNARYVLYWTETIDERNL